MSIIKSFSVGDGDMFYIKHGNSNFTIIDCCLMGDTKKSIVDEINKEREDKWITRFISTHPDEDHIQLLDYLDDRIGIVNFYCVANAAIKSEETEGFIRYKALRDSKKAFYIYQGCTRKWMNQVGKNEHGQEIGSAGINILWPVVTNQAYKDELHRAAAGDSFNNISCIVKYSLKGGLTAIWMGDLETPFMEKIVDEIDLPKTHLLFAPHHGRKSGKVPEQWIDTMDPDIIVMGEANANDSDYASYPDHNKIRQNSAKDIIFECEAGKVHCYSSNPGYAVDFLVDEGKDSFNYYIGTLPVDDE